MTIILILLGVFIALLIYDHFVTRTIMKEGYVVWKTKGNKIWWEYTPEWYLHFHDICKRSRRFRNGVRKH